jgi:hypothetical protein
MNMEKETIIEITRRLYKAYETFNEKIPRKYTVKGVSYNFKIMLNNDPKIILVMVTEGNFNIIEKIVKAIPFLYLCKNAGILTIINN